MILRAFSFVCLLTATPLSAFADARDIARQAAEHLEAAATSLAEADTRRDRIAALTETVRGYELGLSALRESLRSAVFEERAMRAEYSGHADELSRLLAALQSIERSGTATAFAHPEGALSAVRAGMLTADLVPALSSRANVLSADLEDLNAVVLLQRDVETRLETGLAGIRDARLALAQAISNRTDLPPPVATDDAAMQALVNSAETLAGFAASLSGGTVPDGSDVTHWPLPVLGVVLRGYGEAGPDGVDRPGLTIAADAGALVTAPTAGTIRFTGPLLDQGDVVILEPRAGELLILAGLDVAHVQRGQIVSEGALLGQMGGLAAASDQNLIESARDGGQRRSETLYIELRHGGDPVDPTTRFVIAAE